MSARRTGRPVSAPRCARSRCRMLGADPVVRIGAGGDGAGRVSPNRRVGPADSTTCAPYSGASMSRRTANSWSPVIPAWTERRLRSHTAARSIPFAAKKGWFSWNVCQETPKAVTGAPGSARPHAADSAATRRRPRSPAEPSMRSTAGSWRVVGRSVKTSPSRRSAWSTDPALTPERSADAPFRRLTAVTRYSCRRPGRPSARCRGRPLPDTARRPWRADREPALRRRRRFRPPGSGQS